MVAAEVLELIISYVLEVGTISTCSALSLGVAAFVFSPRAWVDSVIDLRARRWPPRAWVYRFIILQGRCAPACLRLWLHAVWHSAGQVLIEFDVYPLHLIRLAPLWFYWRWRRRHDDMPWRYEIPHRPRGRRLLTSATAILSQFSVRITVFGYVPNMSIGIANTNSPTRLARSYDNDSAVRWFEMRLVDPHYVAHPRDRASFVNGVSPDSTEATRLPWSMTGGIDERTEFSLTFSRIGDAFYIHFGDNLLASQTLTALSQSMLARETYFAVLSIDYSQGVDQVEVLPMPVRLQ